MKKNYRIFNYWESDTGNYRDNNEDFVMVSRLDDGIDDPDSGKNEGVLTSSITPGFLALVCDGVGGIHFGEVAAEIAATRFFDYLRLMVLENDFSGLADENLDLVKKAVFESHDAVLVEMEEDPSRTGMATTLTGLWVMGDAAILFNIGDSRVYRFRNQALTQLSHDQSPVGRMVRAGMLTKKSAHTHPLRNYVDQVIGGARKPIKPEVKELQVERDDIYIICSDGLSDSIQDQVIERVIKDNLSTGVEAMGKALVKEAKETEGKDNISVVVLRVGRGRSRSVTTAIKNLFS